jgi:hypothetical protein
MNATELVTAVRVTGRLDDADADFTDARIRQELTDAQQAVFGHTIVQARAGAWLKQLDVTTTADRTRYRLPYRACAGVGESVELDAAGGSLYEIHGDQVVFYSAPSAGSTLRFTYYLRPSLLTAIQTAGAVTAVNTAALTVTVNSLPLNRVTGATIATSNKLDIVHSNGWHELAVVNVAGSISSLTITFPTGTDLTDVEVGDYVRAADQTDWPCLPDDFHRCLANMTAARINRARGNFSRAQEIEKESEGDIGRFADILQPRIKDTRQVIVSRFGPIRGGATWSRFSTSTS